MEFRRFGVNSTSARRMDRAYAHSVSGGAGGRGIRISTGHSALVGSSFGGGYDYLSSSFGSASGTLGITNEKTTMQHLNDRLANYLETVRSLEKANGILEIKIRETIEKKGPLEGRDYSKYEATITELRANVSQSVNANITCCQSLIRFLYILHIVQVGLLRCSGSTVDAKQVKEMVIWSSKSIL